MRDKELRDLELWKTLLTTAFVFLFLHIRLDTEKIEREQANLESKGLGVLNDSFALSWIKRDRYGQIAVGS
ncbi:hypothetical protein Bca52824_093823 [Brassica carinata]|uniref:Uncharacterized protein n=1 Tax=Brassica carinata TaxID=52824 RepID=A0A8X7P527_BRACI|nr:hypothetical protein Bca52824_093823 [Brassica carinata]